MIPETNLYTMIINTIAEIKNEDNVGKNGGKKCSKIQETDQG